MLSIMKPLSIFFMLLTVSFLFSCNKEENEEPVKWPEVSNISVTNITSTTATLNATVNANNMLTKVTFYYSYTRAVGLGGRVGKPANTVQESVEALQSTISGDSTINLRADISGLTPGRTYSFKVRTLPGGISFSSGQAKSFTTPK
jgi:hypothetical protein